ncbi:guanine nucleotide-binding protein subunit alpha [Ilyonectria robusta]
MGCGMSTEEKEGKARNEEIENQLKRDKMMQRNEIKMLLLGAGESGKSTILKQMKLIHEGGYSRDERESFKEIIFSNTVQSMRVILEAMESLELPLEDQRMEYHVQTIFMQPAQIEGDVLPQRLAAPSRRCGRTAVFRNASSDPASTSSTIRPDSACFSLE